MFSTIQKPTLVNFKHFMFKVVELPLKKKKKKGHPMLILNMNQIKRGLNLWIFMKPYREVHGTQLENLCFNHYILDQYIYDVGHGMNA